MGKRETGSSVAVPIFKAFMSEALKDEPLTPFRIPPGLKQIKVNSKTGRRARAGDAKTLWESFVPGTEPGPANYLLDTNGIRDLNAPQPFTDENSYADPYNPEYGTGTGTNNFNNNNENTYTPPPSSEPAFTGTGGLY